MRPLFDGATPGRSQSDAAGDLPLPPMACVGLGCQLALSVIVYRRIRHRPIFFFSVPEARFVEALASGYSNDRWWRRFGGVRNCLVVAVTANRLVIRPWFPFTLMFLPEVCGLEFDVALTDVFSVTVHKGVFKSFVRVRFRNGSARGDVTLILRQPDGFLALLPKTL